MTKPILNLALLDIINAKDRFTGSGDPSVDFQPMICKLDFLQRIAVSLDVNELVTELTGHAYWMLVEIDQKKPCLTMPIKLH